MVARGHVRETVFQIGVTSAPAEAHRRLELEDRLLDEARSLIRRAEREEEFDWAALRFVKHPEFQLWEKILTPDEIEQLLRL